MDFKSYFALLINEATREEIKKFYPKISDEDYNTILDADKTGTKDKVGNLSRLVLDLYKKDKFDTNGEQLHDIYTAFGLVQRKKHLLANTEFAKFSNLNMIPDVKTLIDVSHYLNLLNNGKIKLKATDGQNVDIFYEDDDWIVKIPLDFEASVRIGRDVGNAKWCTASSGAPYHFNRYVVANDLYIFINKHTGKAYQYFDWGNRSHEWHSYTVEFKGVGNTQTNLSKFITSNKLKKVFGNINDETEKIQNNDEYFAKRLLKQYERTKSIYSFLTVFNVIDVKGQEESDRLIGELFKIYKPDLNKEFVKVLTDDRKEYSTLNLELYRVGSKHCTQILDKKTVDMFCQKYQIKNYIINSDLTVDVNGEVNLTLLKHTRYLPIKFRTVKGSFSCSAGSLVSLEGCPETVEGDFSCSNNKLTSLKYLPKFIGGGIRCGDNELTFLENIPKTVNGTFSCSNNKLTSFKGFPETIKGSLFCYGNKFASLKDFPKVIEEDLICGKNPGFKRKDVEETHSVKGKISL